jgi:NitT/TauT family transport system substrate-binding protein
MYWFLVMHKDLGARRGDLEVVKGRSIGAAPWVDLGLRRLLIEAGLDLKRDGVESRRFQGRWVKASTSVSLKDRKIDGFWANGMGAEVAVRRGVGTVVLDVRRGDGPKPCFNYTMASIATSDRLIERSPTASRAAVRAIAGAHAALKEDVTLATKIGRKLFPPAEADLIAELIRRDLPLYDTAISRDFVAGMKSICP